jgi:hypothetical protein
MSAMPWTTIKYAAHAGIRVFAAIVCLAIADKTYYFEKPVSFKWNGFFQL